LRKSLQTDGRTDRRRTPRDCISSWNELKMIKPQIMLHYRKETVQTLRVMPLSTHKKEDFLMFCAETNTNNDMVVFATCTNLRTLAACDIVLMDGTFKSCPRFFMQLYTIFGQTSKRLQ